MKRKTNPRPEDVERMARARKRAAMTQAVESEEEIEKEADRERDQAIARNIDWARRQWILTRPDLSPILKENLVTGATR